MKKMKPQITQRGWHPQPIIAAGIRKCRRKNLGIKTRFGNRVIQITQIFLFFLRVFRVFRGSF